MDKYSGKKLDGRYEIRELIGVGGMANVYHCYDVIDDREVAIKILKDEYLNNEDFIRRFKNESKAIAVLSHPNIVKVYDVSFGDMIQYIVMEYIDGITLKEYIEMQGVLDWKETVHLTAQILQALQHAHEMGIVHRDIKPQNIMLLKNGTIKVTDFGIARFSSNATKTMTEQAIGSVHYIAPEQARGDKTDGKTDIYSLGVMMYEMLTGKLPFDGDSAVSVALKQLQSTARRPTALNPSIPKGLEDIVVKAMRKSPNDRYHSAKDMLEDLERFRLNPNIRFGYNYIDREPTKYVDTRVKKKEEPQKPEEHEKYDFDNDEVKVKSPVLSALKGVIIAAVIVIVVFAGLALYKGYNSSQVADVDVPQFVGLTISQVNEKNEHNFKFEYENRYSDEFKQGQVISQSPEAGTKKVKEGAKITLVVNAADQNVPVPYVSNLKSTDDIKKTISNSNLVPEVLYVSSKEKASTVVKVYPATGQEVLIGTTVYVWVSMGDAGETGKMPDLSGISSSEAQSLLKDAGFTNVTVTEETSETVAKGTVMRQNPLVGSTIKKDYAISIVASSGPKESTETIYVDLPQGVVDEVKIDILVDGVVEDKYSGKTVNLNYNNTYTVELKGKGKVTVVVLLDGQEYREYAVDFDNDSVNVTKTHEYNPPTQPTEPETTIVSPTLPTPEEPTENE